MKISEIYKNRYIAINTLMALVIFAFGIYVGINKQPEMLRAAGLYDKELSAEKEIDLASFWKVWDLIDEKYPDAPKTADKERVYGAISGLLNSLNDPYTVFYPPEDAKTFQEDISGKFIGVGVEVSNKSKVLTVIAPLKNTPAYKAGIQSGDKIIKIDDTLTLGLTLDKAVKLMRGESKKGSAVKLTIEREGEEVLKEITIIRDVITVPTLDAELRSDGVFIIKLYSFSGNATGFFRNAMKKLVETKADKLVLDLRGNPGGYLSAAVDIASWFLPSGKTVIIEDYGDDKEQVIFRSKGYDTLDEDLKVVILIDDGSASASEIFAGAMQDYGRAKIVGEQSFGKGSVQEVVNLNQGSVLKITIAKWLTPKGNSISEKGLTPDYVVPITAEDKKNKKDPQMDKAIEVLKSLK